MILMRDNEKAKHPETAFLLAAGKGTRLRPHTDHTPKPMVPVAGESIIRRTLKKLARSGVTKTVINLHHLGTVLEEHLKDWQEPSIVFSHEDELLETGGSARKALPLIGTEPFYMINGDALWEDDGAEGSEEILRGSAGESPTNITAHNLSAGTGSATAAENYTALSALAALWDAGKMDILLLLQPVAAMALTIGVGDYTLDENGIAHRARQRDGDMMFTGIRIVHPRIFKDTPGDAFSFLTLMDRAEEQGRLYGLAHQGQWHHISTPEELSRVDAHYRANGL